jgi:hypothetical protein
MPKKTTIPKTATDIQVTLFDENYTSEDGSHDDDCHLCHVEHQNSQVFEVSWLMPKRPIRLSIFVCPKCAKEIAEKHDKKSLAEWFPERPNRPREVVVAELAAAYQNKRQALHNLHIEQTKTIDKYNKIIHDINEELYKIDKASQPKIVPCKICGGTVIGLQKFPASTELFASDQYFYQCENGHTGTRETFSDKFEAVKHWNEVMGENNA